MALLRGINVGGSASKKHLTKTTMMKLPQEAVYQQMTVRYHNTVFKLLELFEEV